MQELEIRQIDQALALFQDEILGIISKETELPTLDEDFEKKIESKFVLLHEKINSISEEDEVISLLKSHFQDFMQMIHFQYQNQKQNPGLFFARFFNGQNYLKEVDTRSAEIRQAIIQQRNDQVAMIAVTIQQKIPTLNDAALQSIVNSIAQECSIEACLQCKEAAIKEAQKRNIKLSETLLSDEEKLPLDQALYRTCLNDEFGIDLDELIAWHESEIDKTRNLMMNLASSIAQEEVKEPLRVKELLDEYAGAYDCPSKMMEVGQESFEKVRQFAYSILDLPEEVCELTGVPERLKDSFPWGGYMEGCRYHTPPKGRMFLNDINYQAVSDGWIRMNCIHEAYLGHHIQFVKCQCDPLPETIRRGAKADPISEGVPHRSEEKYAFLFAESKWFPLFIAYRRHHTAVRIKADLWLRYYGKTIGEVTDLYQAELGFDRHTARGQVLAQEQMYGYFTSYYTGVKTILELENQMNFERDELTALLFNAGRISLKNLAKYLALSASQKERYHHDFASLMMNGTEVMKK